MNLYDAWIRALKNTQIIRSRVKPLSVDGDTTMPYVFLAESSVNPGDTVVRRGSVSIQKPSLILPPNMPALEGFDLSDEEVLKSLPAPIADFFLVRGISMPSYRYNNTMDALDVFEGRLSKAIAYYRADLQRQENVQTGLVIGLEDCWQFSILLYNCAQVVKNADCDIERLFREFQDRSGS